MRYPGSNRHSRNATGYLSPRAFSLTPPSISLAVSLHFRVGMQSARWTGNGQMRLRLKLHRAQTHPNVVGASSLPRLIGVFSGEAIRSEIAVRHRGEGPRVVQGWFGGFSWVVANQSSDGEDNPQ